MSWIDIARRQMEEHWAEHGPRLIAEYEASVARSTAKDALIAEVEAIVEKWREGQIALISDVDEALTRYHRAIKGE